MFPLADRIYWRSQSRKGRNFELTLTSRGKEKTKRCRIQKEKVLTQRLDGVWATATCPRDTAYGKKESTVYYYLERSEVDLRYNNEF